MCYNNEKQIKLKFLFTKINIECMGSLGHLTLIVGGSWIKLEGWGLKMPAPSKSHQNTEKNPICKSHKIWDLQTPFFMQK